MSQPTDMPPPGAEGPQAPPPQPPPAAGGPAAAAPAAQAPPPPGAAAGPPPAAAPPPAQDYPPSPTPAPGYGQPEPLPGDEGGNNWVLFAIVMLVLAGAFNIIFGLTAAYRDYLVTVHNGYITVWNIEAWGWLHFVAGCLLILAAAGLWTMRGWARWLAIILAGLDAIIQIGLITFVPAWSLLVIAINILIIYGLAARWDTRAAA